MQNIYPSSHPVSRESVIPPRAGHNDIRRNNLELVLRHLSTVGPDSRAGIAARAGLTRATVSRLVAELIELGAVRETGPRRWRPRRAARAHGWSWASGVLAIGTEVNVDYLSVLVIDLAGREVLRERRPFDASVGPDACIAALADLCRAARRRLASRRGQPAPVVAGLTVAVPGLVDVAPASSPRRRTCAGGTSRWPSRSDGRSVSARHAGPRRQRREPRGDRRIPVGRVGGDAEPRLHHGRGRDRRRHHRRRSAAARHARLRRRGRAHERHARRPAVRLRTARLLGGVHRAERAAAVGAAAAPRRRSARAQDRAARQTGPRRGRRARSSFWPSSGGGSVSAPRTWPTCSTPR